MCSRSCASPIPTSSKNSSSVPTAKRLLTVIRVEEQLRLTTGARAASRAQGAPLGAPDDRGRNRGFLPKGRLDTSEYAVAGGRCAGARSARSTNLSMGLFGSVASRRGCRATAAPAERRSALVGTRTDETAQDACRDRSANLSGHEFRDRSGGRAGAHLRRFVPPRRQGDTADPDTDRPSLTGHHDGSCDESSHGSHCRPGVRSPCMPCASRRRRPVRPRRPMIASRLSADGSTLTGTNGGGGGSLALAAQLRCRSAPGSRWSTRCFQCHWTFGSRQRIVTRGTGQPALQHLR